MVMNPQQIQKKAAEPVTAVVPLNKVALEDIGKAAQAVDQWLRSISFDYVTLKSSRTSRARCR